MAKGKKAARQEKRAAKKAPKKAAKAQKKAVKKEKMVVKKSTKVSKRVDRVAKKNPKRASKIATRKTKRAVKKASGKTLGNKLKAKGKSLKHQITNPIETLKNVAKNAKQGAEFVALLPMRVAMLAILKQRDVRVPRKASIKEIASLFYVNVIAKESLEQLEHADEQTGEDVAFEVAKDVAANSGIPGSQAAVGIVQAILNWFQARKKKKNNEKADKEGSDEPIETLTQEEKKVADDTPISEEEEKVLDDVDKKMDVIAKNTGGKDSKGNIHPAPDTDKDDNKDESQEDVDAVKDASEGKKYGPMRLFSRSKI